VHTGTSRRKKRKYPWLNKPMFEPTHAEEKTTTTESPGTDTEQVELRSFVEKLRTHIHGKLMEPFTDAQKQREALLGTP